jgi:hypothetical protein
MNFKSGYTEIQCEIREINFFTITVVKSMKRIHNKIETLYSLEDTEIPNMFFTPHHRL